MQKFKSYAKAAGYLAVMGVSWPFLLAGALCTVAGSTAYEWAHTKMWPLE